MFENNIREYLKKHNFESFRPKVVLFDMDGTLYNSMPKHAQAWQEAMKSFGLDMSEADAYATEGMRGVETIRNMVREQWGRDIGETEAQKMYNVKGKLFHQMPLAPVFDGVLGIMKKIKDSGLTIGVVTGSAQKLLFQRLVDDFHDYLNPKNIITAYSNKRGKPAPDPFLSGLRLTGNYKPWEGIVVENAPMGVKSGVAAQIFTIAINTGPLPDQTLIDEGANLIFPAMTAFSEVWDQFFNDANQT